MGISKIWTNRRMLALAAALTASLVAASCGDDKPTTAESAALAAIPADMPSLVRFDVAALRAEGGFVLEDSEKAMLVMGLLLPLGPGPADAAAAVPPGSPMPMVASAWLATFTANTGIDPLKDMDVILSGSDGSAGPGGSVSVFSGRNLDEAKLTAWLKSAPFGTHVSERIDVEGVGAYVLPATGGIDDALTSVAFLDANTVVAGRGLLVHKVVASAKGAPMPSTGSAVVGTAMTGTGAAMSAATVAAATPTRPGAKPLLSECAEGALLCYANADPVGVERLASSMMVKGLTGAQSIVLSAVLSPAAVVTAKVRFADASGVAAAAEQVKTSLTEAKALIGAMSPMVGKALDLLTVTAAGNDVVLTLTPTTELLTELRASLNEPPAPRPGMGMPPGARPGMGAGPGMGPGPGMPPGGRPGMMPPGHGAAPGSGAPAPGPAPVAPAPAPGAAPAPTGGATSAPTP